MSKHATKKTETQSNTAKDGRTGTQLPSVFDGKAPTPEEMEDDPASLPHVAYPVSDLKGIAHELGILWRAATGLQDERACHDFAHTIASVRDKVNAVAKSLEGVVGLPARPIPAPPESSRRPKAVESTKRDAGTVRADIDGSDVDAKAIELQEQGDALLAEALDSIEAVRRILLKDYAEQAAEAEAASQAAE